LNLPARGPCFVLPVRARRAKARERLPSYREPASRNPQAMHPETCWEPCTRAPFRLLSIRAPRQAVLRTSSWLAPSLFHQQVLRPPGGEDARCVQPTSATQSNCVHPHLARSRLAFAAFAARTPRGVLGSTRHYRGNGRFTTSKTASADRDVALISSSTASRPGERAWACCSHGAHPIEPLTPLSRSSVHPLASVAFATAALWPPVLLLEGFERVGGV
jgi:hypothetical protein